MSPTEKQAATPSSHAPDLTQNRPRPRPRKRSPEPDFPQTEYDPEPDLPNPESLFVFVFGFGFGFGFGSGRAGERESGRAGERESLTSRSLRLTSPQLSLSHARSPLQVRHPPHDLFMEAVDLLVQMPDL